VSCLLPLLAVLGMPLSGARQPQPSLLRQEAPALSVTLEELRAAPGRFLGEEVRFQVQLRALVEDWDAYLSRFEPGRWLALEVWPDERFTWDAAVFASPVGKLFLRRGGGFEPLARRAQTYQRFAAHARVREVFLGEPWLEVLELVPLDGEVGEGTILHVTRARELASQGQFSLALDQYERARAAPLPPHALAALLEEIRATEEARAQAKAEGRGDTEQKPEKAEKPEKPEKRGAPRSE
jgi:hypothetical protein